LENDLQAQLNFILELLGYVFVLVLTHEAKITFEGLDNLLDDVEIFDCVDGVISQFH